jgi:regulator of sigma E protease
MTTLFAFIIVLGILIFFHELGHFLLAKINGVGVLKFSLGFGPAIIKKRIGETEYRISAIPLGGYVKMLGENVLDEEEITHIDLDRSFSNKGLKARAAIVAAGPAFNLLLAIFIYTIIAWWGIPAYAPVIGDLLDASPAYKAGLMSGDRIVSIDGNPVELWEDISILLSDASPDKRVEMTIQREENLFTIHVSPVMTKDKNIFGEEVERPMIGISRGDEIITKRLGFLSGIGYGLAKTYQVIELTGIAIKKMVDGTLDIKESLGGPILIAQVSGETFKAGMMPFFFMIAFVSINLGLINLLPIPILDGGFLLFFLIEGITGKPIEGRPREIAQQIGLFLLILLMLFAFYNDLMRVFKGD